MKALFIKKKILLFFHLCRSIMFVCFVMLMYIKSSYFVSLQHKIFVFPLCSKCGLLSLQPNTTHVSASNFRAVLADICEVLKVNCLFLVV